jgi:hypothetical protein
MVTYSFVHSPGLGQFYLQDPVEYDNLAKASFTKADVDRKFHVGKGIITVFVISQGSEIPIVVESVPAQLPVQAREQWDWIIECSLEAGSGSLVLAGCPDGPEYGRFGAIPISPGNYGVRVYYGGQDTTDDQGCSKDFYRIEIWPSVPIPGSVVKGSQQ